MELIGMTDERVFKKRTKLIVIKFFYCLTVFMTPYRLQTCPAAMRPTLCIYLCHYRNCIASGEDDLEYHG
jgi:hypothetical protein